MTEQQRSREDRENTPAGISEKSSTAHHLASAIPQTTIINGRMPGKTRGERFAWIPLPLLVVAIGVLAFLPTKFICNPPFLLPVLNVLFLTVILSFVSLLAAKSYLDERSNVVLFLGCGALVFGLVAMLAGFPLVSPNANWSVAVYTTGAFLSAVCHLISAVDSFFSGRRKTASGWPFLAGAHVGMISIVVLLGAAIHARVFPVFYVDGERLNVVCLAVLWASAGMFTLSALLLNISYGRNRDPFIHWYSLGLGLLAVGLAGVSLQGHPGSPLSWVCRFSQYLGSIYMLIAVVVTVRKSGRWNIPLENALAASEKRFRTLASATFEGIIITEHGVITDMNEQLSRMCGYGRSELIGRPVIEFAVPEDRERLVKIVREGKDFTGEYRAACKDGSQMVVNAHGRTIELEGKPVRITVIRDITERKLAEKERRRNTRRFALLAGTASELLQSTDPQQLIEPLCRQVMQFLDCHAFFNYLVDDRSGRLHLNAFAGITADAAKQIEWLEKGSTVCGCVARDGIRVVTEHIPTTSDARTELVRSYGIKAYACHPLLTKGGKTIGTLSFGSRNRETFSDEDLSLMKAVADQVSVAMTRLKYEQALRASEERFRAVLDSSRDAAYRRDLLTDTYDYMSPVIEQITGYTPEEFTCLNMETVLGMIHPDDLPTVRLDVEKVMSSGELSHPIEYRLRTKQGSYVWVADSLRVINDGNGIPRYRVGIVSDITERKRMEEALRESEKRFRTLAEHSPDIIARFDACFKLSYLNSAVARIGWSAEGILGRSIDEMKLSTEQVVFWKTHLQWVLATRSEKRGELSHSIEGRKTYFSLVFVPEFDRHGKVEGVLALARDVTDLKELTNNLEEFAARRTKELLRAHAELERAQRMSDIGRLASTIAHEIRNPLAAIRTAAYNINRKAKNSALDRHIATINKKVIESDHIIQNLLAFTKVKSANFEAVKVRDVLNDCLMTVSMKYSSWGVQLQSQTKTCTHDDVIEVDVTQFKMLVNNILDNAFQALPDKQGRINVLLDKKTKEYRLSVSDDGIGIAEEEQEKIFEPFYTTKSRGTGLGLTICREIVDVHGGLIELQSRKGDGTTVTVALPAKQPALAANSKQLPGDYAAIAE